MVLGRTESVRPQHDVLKVAHHRLNQRGQSVTLQGLQEGLVEVLCGVSVARVETVVAKRLRTEKTLKTWKSAQKKCSNQGSKDGSLP